MKKNRLFSLTLCGVLLFSLLFGVSAADEEIDMEFKNAPLVDVFHVLGELAGYNVLIDPTVTGTVSFYLKDLGVQQALDLLARTTGYSYQIVDNTLVIASDEKLKREFIGTEFIFLILDNISVDTAVDLVNIIVPDVKTFTDVDYNVIVIYGAASEVTTAKKLLEQYDAISKGYTFNIDGINNDVQELSTQSIPVNWADGEEILRFLQQYWPNRQFSWNEQLRLLTGTTTTAEWDEIVIIIAEKDIPNFVVKGIITSSGKNLVLVEYRGSTTLVEQGQSFVGWTLTDITNRKARFVQGERNFVIEMGR
ncbi:MAG: hypothetical protein GX994_03765 [Firmicutes bacterium]|nr:hypothetical protein [Bacillota bacterium]